jgi:hypothetical protein
MNKPNDKYKSITAHPQKEKIDGWLLGGMSYREIEKKLLKDHKSKISYQTLRRYHKDTLGGMIEEDAGGADLLPLPSKLEIDTLEVQKIIECLEEADNNHQLKDAIKKPLFEIFALQTQITLDAIKQHIDGGCRYPSEYVVKLNAIFGMIAK